MPLQAESYLLITPITLANLSLNPNSNQQAPDATSFFPVGGMPTASSLAWKTSLRKADAVALQQIKERGALPMIDRGDIRQAIDRCSNIWASLPGAGYGQFGCWVLTAWLQNSKKRRNGQRDWCGDESPLSPFGYLHHRLPVMGWKTITVITPLPTSLSATKMPENWSWRTRQLLTCRCVSVMLLRSMQNTRRS